MNQKYMKLPTKDLLFTDESRTTLDVPTIGQSDGSF